MHVHSSLQAYVRTLYLYDYLWKIEPTNLDIDEVVVYTFVVDVLKSRTWTPIDSFPSRQKTLPT